MCIRDRPKVAFKETIRGKVEVRGKYKKQSGGHGQYGDVLMEFEPSGDLETPYVFDEKIFGGAVPKLSLIHISYFITYSQNFSVIDFVKKAVLIV